MKNVIKLYGTVSIACGKALVRALLDNKELAIKAKAEVTEFVALCEEESERIEAELKSEVEELNKFFMEG